MIGKIPMKKIYSLIFAALLIPFALLQAQVDRSKAPQPGPAPKINIGQYESFTLKNGLRVFVVENHKLPMISFSLVFDADPVPEKDKAGISDLFGSMLRGGTRNLTKEQLDDAIDFVGAEISATATSVNGYCLTRHQDKVFELFAELVRHPSFPAEELERLRKQAISGLAAEVTDPSAIASKMMLVANFGANHTYGEVVTENSLKAITIDDIKSHHQRVFTPSIGYLAIVGDITPSVAKALVEKYFSDWQGGKPVKFTPAAVKAPSASQVYLHNLETAVQSTIRLTYPVDLHPSNPDRLALSVLQSIFGGGSTGRLYKNLRETHGYTYGAYCSFSPDKYVGYFTISADVRNEVTDSAIIEIIKEMRELAMRGITAEELEAVKKEMTGSFARSLENPRTVANFAINIHRYKLPKDYYETYLQRLNALTVEQVNAVAKKYILPFNFNLVVVGKQEEIEKGLLAFDADQRITLLDAFAAPAAELMPVPEGLTLDQVIESYFTYVGGKDKVAGIRDLSSKAVANIQGFTIEFETIFVAPGHMRKVQRAMGQSSGSVILGDKGSEFGPDGSTEMSEQALADELATIHPVLEYNLYTGKGLKAELEGMRMVKGIKCYQVKYITPANQIIRGWYNANTGAKVQELHIEETAQGKAQIVTQFRGSMEVGGIRFPAEEVVNMGGMEINAVYSKIEINTGLTPEAVK